MDAKDVGTMTAQRMNATIKAAWLTALRSGRYKYGRGRLRCRGKFCAIGVLCDVIGIGKWRGSYYVIQRYPTAGFAPRAVLETAGLSYADHFNVATLNDHTDSFAAAADYIERHL